VSTVCKIVSHKQIVIITRNSRKTADDAADLMKNKKVRSVIIIHKKDNQWHYYRARHDQTGLSEKV
jgi:hypothetical protein